jgi:hypothetical protein
LFAGDIIIAMTTGGTRIISVIWYFSMFFKNISRSNRLIIYVRVPPRSGEVWVAGALAAWKNGSDISRFI